MDSIGAKGPLVALRMVNLLVLNRLNFLPRLLSILMITHTMCLVTPHCLYA